MLFIANNISTRNMKVERIFRQAKEKRWKGCQEESDALRATVGQCINAGADILEINVQQRYDLPEAMDFAVSAIQEVTERQLCLSTNSAAALKAGLDVCQRPPIANYLSFDIVRLKDMLPPIAGKSACVILLVSDPTSPVDAREMVQRAAVLIGSVNEAGISNENIFVDPGLIHTTSDAGQHHLKEVMDFLRTLPEVADPQVKSTCWLANCSAGAPRWLRPTIETALLPMLSGAGISSVFLDVLQRDNRQAMRLIKIFNNEMVYADSELEL
jgi:cobalamin-dependent methionine synthase I